LSSDRPRFIVDTMLGKLARYLRILGYDTKYSTELRDEEIINECLSGRILLTSDKQLHLSASKRRCVAIHIPSGLKIPEMLALLAREGLVELSIDITKSRCPICNGELKREPDRANSHLGRRYETYICRRCGNIYWIGKHWRTMLRIINEAKKHASGPG
jgi:uncharacterized protein with PIN domain